METEGRTGPAYWGGDVIAVEELAPLWEVVFIGDTKTVSAKAGREGWGREKKIVRALTIF